MILKSTCPATFYQQQTKCRCRLSRKARLATNCESAVAINLLRLILQGSTVSTQSIEQDLKRKRKLSIWPAGRFLHHVPTHMYQAFPAWHYDTALRSCYSCSTSYHHAHTGSAVKITHLPIARRPASSFTNPPQLPISCTSDVLPHRQAFNGWAAHGAREYSPSSGPIAQSALICASQSCRCWRHYHLMSMLYA